MVAVQEATAGWSRQRVEGLAPDAAALKAAQGVAQVGKWKSLGRAGPVAWGECAGSGASPYQVRAELIEGAFSCSCPSRKLPCKHSLGLLLLLADGHVGETARPEFVDDWLAQRAKRADAKQARAARAAAPPDAAAQAERIERREARIDAGIDQLESWLADAVRQGLAALRTQPTSFFAQTAARLIDAQAPGLARRVRDLGALASSDDWAPRLLTGLARLQLLIDAYRALDRLPAALAAEVRTQIGWTQSQAALLERDGVRDRWQVVGQRREQQEQMQVQRTWLCGLESGRSAMLLDFAVGNQPLSNGFGAGEVLDAELVYFDAAIELRALIKTRHASASTAASLPGALDVATMQQCFAERLAQNPWLDSWPCVLGPVLPRIDGDRLRLVDGHGRVADAPRGCRHAWPLVALAADGALQVFGEWDGHALTPLTCAAGGGLYSLARVGDLAILAKAA